MSLTASCPACQGPLVPWQLVPASDPALGAEMFQLARCTVCGSAVTLGATPPPDLYERGAYRPGKPRLAGAARPLLSLFDRQRLSLISAQGPAPARLLDAGAGRGRFVATARRAGALGVPVTRHSIERAELKAESLDVISLWHVLEHLENPAAALARLRSWLRPGGILLVGVPNLGSLQARIGGGRWYHLDVPRHRVHFTVAGLTRLAESQGLEVVATHQLLLEHNPFGMWQSGLNRLTRRPSYLYHLLKRNVPVQARDLSITLLALPLIPVAAALELAAGAARRGGTFALVARRPS